MGGWGNGGMMAAANGALTRADLCSEFNFNGLENAVRGVICRRKLLTYGLIRSILYVEVRV